MKSTRSTRRTCRVPTRRSSLELVAETPKNSPKEATSKRRSVLPHFYNVQSRARSAGSSECPSPELGLQNKKGSRSQGGGGGREGTSQGPRDDRILEDSDESRTHFRVLMSWESDYLRGSKATRGPILYVMETMRGKLDSIKGS